MIFFKLRSKRLIFLVAIASQSQSQGPIGKLLEEQLLIAKWDLHIYSIRVYGFD